MSFSYTVELSGVSPVFAILAEAGHNFADGLIACCDVPVSHLHQAQYKDCRLQSTRRQIVSAAQKV